MIAEIGQQGRWIERIFLIVAALCLIPVVLFVGGAVWDLIRRGRVSSEVFIGLGGLVMGSIFSVISHTLEAPRKPYRLDAAEYSNYKVVEARVIKLGMVTKRRPSYDSYRKSAGNPRRLWPGKGGRRVFWFRASRCSAERSNPLRSA